MVFIRRLHLKAYSSLSYQFCWLGKCRNLHKPIVYTRKYLHCSESSLILSKRKQINNQPERILLRRHPVSFQCYAVRDLQHDATTETIAESADVVSSSDIELSNGNNNIDVEFTGNNSSLESFADYGLGGWDFPHHWIQSILEYFHATVGISWMPTIAIATVILRTLALPAYIKMRETNALSHNHLPKTMELQMQINTPNRVERKRKQLEYMEYLRNNNLNPIKPLLFQLPTAVIFISFFSALRGMAEAKLPSLVNGGTLWFTNLTIPDPYFLLPVFACVSMHLLIRYGAAVSEVGPAASVPILKKILLWSPFVFFPFMAFQPSCMYLFWITSNVFSFLLMLLFLKPNVQRAFGIPELIRHPDSMHDQWKQYSTSMRGAFKARQEAKTREIAFNKFKDHMDKMEKFSKENKQ